MKLFTLIASITIFPIALYSSLATAKVGPVDIRSDGPSNYNKENGIATARDITSLVSSKLNSGANQKH